MYLLNYILITFVTLTQSASLTVPNQTKITLPSIIAEHPNFLNTLLNKTLVPFINECVPDARPITKTLCGSYFEMVKKLDDSKVYNLKSVEGFNQALNMHKEDRIQEFCMQFPGYLPTDVKQYPQSNQLNKYVNDSTKCQICCMDDTELDSNKVKQVCTVLRSGWEEALAQQSISTTNKELTEGQHPKNLQAETTLKSGAKLKVGGTSNSGTTASASVSSQTVNAKPEDVPTAVEKTVPVVEIVKANAKVNLGGNAELPGNPNDPQKNPNTEKEESAPKPITSTSQVNDNKNAIATPVEENPVGKDQIPNIIVQQPSGPSGPSGDTKFENMDVGKEEMDKTNPKTSVTDTDDSIMDNNNDLDENKLENDLKDKLPNLNEDDLPDDIDDKQEDGPEDSDDEELGNSNVLPNVLPKSSQEAGPSKSQIMAEQNDPFSNDTDSNFFTYFMFLLLVCVIGYVVYHNKTKMLALMLEGRRSSVNGRSGLSRRKHTAAYRKLDSNLEEAITSSANGRSTQVIY